MKVALCISGQPRYFDIAFPYIKKNIIEKNDCDVFLHCWFDSSKVNQPYDSASWNIGNADIIKKDTPKRLLELYEPIYFKIEPQKFDLFPSNRTEKDYPLTQGENIALANFSMFYSMMQAATLCHAYEGVYGNYDVIIRCRFDLAIMDELILEKYEIHNQSNEICYADLCRNKLVMSDWLFWGSSKQMRYMMNVYNLLDRYVMDENVMLCGEEILSYHLNKINCKRNPKPISGYLVRDLEFTNRQFGASF